MSCAYALWVVGWPSLSTCPITHPGPSLAPPLSLPLSLEHLRPFEYGMVTIILFNCVVMAMEKPDVRAAPCRGRGRAGQRSSSAFDCELCPSLYLYDAAQIGGDDEMI